METHEITKKEIHKIKQNKDETNIISINIGQSKNSTGMKESVLLNFPEESECIKDFLSPYTCSDTAFLSEEQSTALTDCTRNISDRDAIISSIGLDLC